MTSTVDSAPYTAGPKDHVIPTHGRRDWVARITGTDPKFNLKRDFLPKAKHTRHTISGNTYQVWGTLITEPGVYQWQTKEYGAALPTKELQVWTGQTWESFDGDLVDLVKRLRRHNPKTWKTLTVQVLEHAPRRGLDQCTVCPRTLEHFTPDGWAVCDTHLEMFPPVDTVPALPDLPAPTVTA